MGKGDAQGSFSFLHAVEDEITSIGMIGDSFGNSSCASIGGDCGENVNTRRTK